MGIGVGFSKTAKKGSHFSIENQGIHKIIFYGCKGWKNDFLFWRFLKIPLQYPFSKLPIFKIRYDKVNKQRSQDKIQPFYTLPVFGIFGI